MTNPMIPMNAMPPQTERPMIVDVLLPPLPPSAPADADALAEDEVGGTVGVMVTITVSVSPFWFVVTCAETVGTGVQVSVGAALVASLPSVGAGGALVSPFLVVAGALPEGDDAGAGWVLVFPPPEVAAGGLLDVGAAVSVLPVPVSVGWPPADVCAG